MSHVDFFAKVMMFHFECFATFVIGVWSALVFLFTKWNVPTLNQIYNPLVIPDDLLWMKNDVKEKTLEGWLSSVEPFARIKPSSTDHSFSIPPIFPPAMTSSEFLSSRVKPHLLLSIHSNRDSVFTFAPLNWTSPLIDFEKSLGDCGVHSVDGPTCGPMDGHSYRVASLDFDTKTQSSFLQCWILFFSFPAGTSITWKLKVSLSETVIYWSIQSQWMLFFDFIYQVLKECCFQTRRSVF